MTSQNPSDPAKPAKTGPLGLQTGGPTPSSGAKARADKPVPAPVGQAKLRSRHWLVLTSFIVVFVIPCLVAAWYLWTRAADQYASNMGFSVRTEEVSSAIELLGGITELSGSSSSDTDILYRFLKGQKLVRAVDDALDLRTIWSKADPDVDPIFAYHPPGTIEDLTEYWLRMVKIYYDSSSGLIDLRVLAFDPVDAQKIAEKIMVENSAMINSLSAIAREDTLRYAREELATSLERLKEARQSMTTFRNANRIVDPEANVQGQVGLITTLQNQLATALIDYDLLLGSTSDSDPRLEQAQRKIEVIEARIEGELRKVGAGTQEGGDGAYAELIGQYESIAVDREFAEQSYRAALAGFEAAQAEARRQSRYLAAHVQPTLAERPEYPERLLLMLTFASFLFLAWGLLVLVAYSLKDRR